MIRFGCNSKGELGFGDLEPRHAPQLLRPPNSEAVSDVVLGRFGSAIKAGAQWYVAGESPRVHLGLTGGDDGSGPVAVPPVDGHPVTNAALSDWAAAVEAGGRWYASGRNFFGKLCLGHESPQPGPTALPPLSGHNVTHMVRLVPCVDPNFRPPSANFRPQL